MEEAAEAGAKVAFDFIKADDVPKADPSLRGTASTLQSHFDQHTGLWEAELDPEVPLDRSWVDAVVGAECGLLSVGK